MFADAFIDSAAVVPIVTYTSMVVMMETMVVVRMETMMLRMENMVVMMETMVVTMVMITFITIDSASSRLI